MNNVYSSPTIWSLLLQNESPFLRKLHSRNVGVSHAKLKEEKLLLNIA
ncbi:hypothetical protein CLV99_0922 [Sphingobacterium yanglingense]|uniref:Uncharacterized protein n=1 Tax=Sphingobacterium yanglingense TaxID=1437280 RepID=A0A4R6WH82_9SPHI|nr:hypothetical protein CLV99_0922 [Sphingobacterium yanglingense]